MNETGSKPANGLGSSGSDGHRQAAASVKEPTATPRPQDPRELRHRLGGNALGPHRRTPRCTAGTEDMGLGWAARAPNSHENASRRVIEPATYWIEPQTCTASAGTRSIARRFSPLICLCATSSHPQSARSKF